jgi:RimJ/RimL family protein N-acetyltransferase
VELIIIQKKKGNRKPKLDAYFSDLNVMEEDHDHETIIVDRSSQSKATTMKIEAVPEEEKNHFYGKLRRFLVGKSEGELLPVESESEKSCMAEYCYIQMDLPWEKITPQYLANLEKYRKSDLSSRIARDADLAVLCRLYNRSFMKTTDPWSPLTEAQFKEILHFGNTMIFIASYMGTDVGFSILDFEGSENDVGVICGLSVDPSYQKRGFSKYLSLISLDFFLTRNVKKLHCEVFVENKASYHMIKSLGFEEDGTKTYAY